MIFLFIKAGIEQRVLKTPVHVSRLGIHIQVPKDKEICIRCKKKNHDEILTETEYFKVFNWSVIRWIKVSVLSAL